MKDKNKDRNRDKDRVNKLMHRRLINKDIKILVLLSKLGTGY